MTKQGIIISSAAMYSTWCYHQPTRVLFDAGEGMTNYLRSRMFGIQNVMITHMDSDHCLGLLSLIGLRAKTKGDREKDLTIYVPSGDPRWTAMRDYVDACWSNLPYRLRWFPIDPGFELQLGSGHRIVAFQTQHRHTMSLGYKVVETRWRLKPEFRGQDIRALLASGVDKDMINESYTATTFAWCLDAFSFNPADIAGATLAVMDSTFIRDGDRIDNSHMTATEAIAVCREAGVKNIILAHLSTRYGPEHQREFAEQMKLLDIPTKVCFTDSILEL
jgi:ribonuclease Z